MSRQFLAHYMQGPVRVMEWAELLVPVSLDKKTMTKSLEAKAALEM
jgi:hypothetical protein